MGSFIAKHKSDRKHYATLTKKAFKKLLFVCSTLRAYNIKSSSRTMSTISYYDTPENLLKRTGILLYKTFENGKYYFKIERLSFIPKSFRQTDEQIFVHEIAQRDTPEEHSLYLIDAITSMFSTQFRVDLENVIKMAKPKLIIQIKADVYKVYGGTGFKCDIALENVIYKNFETKRKVKNKEITITMDCPLTFKKHYEEFLALLNKKCKEIAEMNESRYEHAVNITKSINSVDKKSFKKVKTQKEIKRNPEDIIEG